MFGVSAEPPTPRLVKPHSALHLERGPTGAVLSAAEGSGGASSLESTDHGIGAFSDPMSIHTHLLHHGTKGIESRLTGSWCWAHLGGVEKCLGWSGAISRCGCQRLARAFVAISLGRGVVGCARG